MTQTYFCHTRKHSTEAEFAKNIKICWICHSSRIESLLSLIGTIINSTYKNKLIANVFDESDRYFLEGNLFNLNFNYNFFATFSFYHRHTRHLTQIFSHTFFLPLNFIGETIVKHNMCVYFLFKDNLIASVLSHRKGSKSTNVLLFFKVMSLEKNKWQ